MERKTFLKGLAIACAELRAGNKPKEAMAELFHFKDDGTIPNSKFPLIIYRSAFSQHGNDGAAWLEQQFAENNWSNSWRNGVYPFHHYHSISHEVLGIYSGSATLHMGGEKGEKLQVQAGDILVIPAGVGHKKLGAGNSFGVVGAYPQGHDWDVMRGLPGERPQADKNIAAVLFPTADPLFGKNKGLKQYWK
jgi:uncharacterized protein YjlB